MKEKVQWGIVGTGQIAADLAISLQASRRGRIVNACGSSPEKARAFAAKWGLPRSSSSLEELLADPDSRMGKTAKLADGDRAALAAYLRSL